MCIISVYKNDVITSKNTRRKHHPAVSLSLSYKQNQCEIFEILSSKLIGSMWNPREWTRLEANCLLEAFKSTCENMQKRWNPRKSSKILDEYPTKISEKSCLEHVQVALCKNSAIFMSGALLTTFRLHFAPSAEISWILSSKLIGSMWNPREWTLFEANCLLEAFKNTCENMKKRRNPRKSSKILDKYPTKIDEK